MKKNIFKLIIFIFTGLVLLILIPGIIFAVNTISTGFRVTKSSSATIDASSISGGCKIINNNNSTNDIFVPTKTLSQWNSFLDHLPYFADASGCMASSTAYTIGQYPYTIAYDGSNMWTGNGNNTVSKITSGGTVTTYSGASSGVLSMAYDGTNMWLAANNGAIRKIAPTGSMTSYSSVKANDITFDGTNMWTCSFVEGSITKISPSGVSTTYTGIGTYNSISGGSLTAIAFDGTYLWVTDEDETNGVIYKISTAGAKLATYSIMEDPADIAIDDSNYKWIVGYDSVNKVSPGGTVTTYSGGGGGHITYDGTNMWTSNSSGTITRISPAGAMLSFSVGGRPEGIAAGSNSIWVVDYNNSRVIKRY